MTNVTVSANVSYKCVYIWSYTLLTYKSIFINSLILAYYYECIICLSQ